MSGRQMDSIKKRAVKSLLAGAGGRKGRAGHTAEEDQGGSWSSNRQLPTVDSRGGAAPAIERKKLLSNSRGRRPHAKPER